MGVRVLLKDVKDSTINEQPGLFSKQMLFEEDWQS